MSGKASGRRSVGGGMPSHFTNSPGGYWAAQLWATEGAKLLGAKWFVCLRLNRWYALPPGMASSARGNPNWPGKQLSEERIA